MSRCNEQELYEPVRKALEEYFNQSGKCHLEVTAKSRASEYLKGKLEEYSLYLNEIEPSPPDLTGFFSMKYTNGFRFPPEIIVVEIKDTVPKIADIYQLKRYAEVFDAKYGILVGSKPLPEEKRSIILRKAAVLQYVIPESEIGKRFRIEHAKIVHFSREVWRLVDSTWFPSRPLDDYFAK